VSKRLQKQRVDITSVVFSDNSARVMARILGIKPEQTDKFRAAFSLLPLSRLKECIDVAYELSKDGDGVEAIGSWLDRYERQGKEALPQWARKNSWVYLKEARAELEGSGSSLTTTLFEFKGFIYAVFCRRLIDYYCEVRNDKSTTNDSGPEPVKPKSKPQPL
jgi:hypothetical protein